MEPSSFRKQVSERKKAIRRASELVRRKNQAQQRQKPCSYESDLHHESAYFFTTQKPPLLLTPNYSSAGNVQNESSYVSDLKIKRITSEKKIICPIRQTEKYHGALPCIQT